MWNILPAGVLILSFIGGIFLGGEREKVEFLAGNVLNSLNYEIGAAAENKIGEIDVGGESKPQNLSGEGNIEVFGGKKGEEKMPVSETGQKNSVLKITEGSLGEKDILNEEEMKKESETASSTVIAVEVEDKKDYALKEVAGFLEEEKRECAFSENDDALYQGVIINEVAWMGGKSGATDEWIELKNTSSRAAYVSGWKILNGDGSLRVVLSEGVIILSGDFYLLERTDDNSVEGEKADFIYKGVLANNNEALFLLTKDCVLADKILAKESWPAGDVSFYKTMERDMNGISWHTSSVEGGTPKKENSEKIAVIGGSVVGVGVSTVSGGISQSGLNLPVLENNSSVAVENSAVVSYEVKISEVRAGSEAGTDDEFIKICNKGSGEVNLSGWTVKKRNATGGEDTFISAKNLEGVKIGAGNCILTVNKEGYKGGEAPNIITWPKSYTLAYKNNAVIIYDGEGKKIDEASWESLEKGEIRGF